MTMTSSLEVALLPVLNLVANMTVLEGDGGGAALFAEGVRFVEEELSSCGHCCFMAVKPLGKFASLYHCDKPVEKLNFLHLGMDRGLV